MSEDILGKQQHESSELQRDIISCALQKPRTEVFSSNGLGKTSLLRGIGIDIYPAMVHVRVNSDIAKDAQ